MAVGTGTQEYLKDLGVKLPLRVHTDSSAAKGIAIRVGLGTQRHIATNTLWVQERLRSRAFKLYKVKGEENPADFFTKHLNSEMMCKFLKFMGATFRQGRAEVAPEVKEDEQLDIDEDMEMGKVDDETREEVLESWKKGARHP